MVVAEHMFDQTPPINYQIMPRCIYTQPEVASLGLNVEEAKAEGYKATVKVPFKAIGKVVIEDNKNQSGFCEID